MKTMKELKEEALKSTTFRGHEMSEWRDYSSDRAVCDCIHCGKGVWVIVNPMPNEIDIAGEAVALNCD